MQLTPQEVMGSKRVSQARIHVECAIGKIKTYHIPKGDFPISMLDVAEQIFTVCAFLKNFSSPILHHREMQCRGSKPAVGSRSCDTSHGNLEFLASCQRQKSRLICLAKFVIKAVWILLQSYRRLTANHTS